MKKSYKPTIPYREIAVINKKLEYEELGLKNVLPTKQVRSTSKVKRIFDS